MYLRGQVPAIEDEDGLEVPAEKLLHAGDEVAHVRIGLRENGGKLPKSELNLFYDDGNLIPNGYELAPLILPKSNPC